MFIYSTLLFWLHKLAHETQRISLLCNVLKYLVFELKSAIHFGKYLVVHYRVCVSLSMSDAANKLMTLQWIPQSRHDDELLHGNSEGVAHEYGIFRPTFSC
jgi:hypothetical protein